MKKFDGTQNLARTAARSLLLALVLALGFSSCDNMSDNGPASFFFPTLVQTTDEQASSQRATVTFCGSIGVAGALPDEMSAKVRALEASLGAAVDVSKSAQPELSIGKEAEYYYYVSAIPQDSVGNLPVEYGRNDNGEGGKFSGGSNGITYSLPLNVGQWIIECGIKNSEDKPVLKASSGLLTLDATQSVVSRTFTASPVSVSDAGNGNILLIVNKGSFSTILSGVARWKDSNGTEQSKALVDASTIGSGYSSDLLALKVDGIAPGAYTMTISFYNNSDPNNTSAIMLYQTSQTVSVFSGMLTNKWVSNGGTDNETNLITDDGFIISPAAVDIFKSSSLYVGSHASTAPGYRGPSDTNEGSFLAPFATLQKAVDTITATGKSSLDYTIYVCGTLSENVNFSSALGGSDPTTRKARSITLANLDGSNSAVIEGGGAAGSETIIQVGTAVPIKIRGVKITKQASAAYSRGLTINDSNARVTLLEGAEISGNNASTNGGGVYITDGTLCMKGGVIKENTAGHGGAVYNLGGAFEISGSAYIPYGDASGNKGAGKNDVHLAYDSANNVYKYITIAGALNPPAAAGSDKTIATIDADGWNRGKQILSAAASVNLSQYAGADKKYFAFVDKDAFTTCKASTPTVAKLQAPLYVSPAGLSGNTGSKDSPYDSIATALGHFNDTEEDCVINIDGEVKGTNTINSAHCSKLVIQGANGLYEADTVVDGKTIAKGTPKDSLNGNKAGSVLKIDTSVPVVIRNLKIFGGTGYAYGTTSAGGGICMMLNNCDVTLDSGCLIGDVLNPSAPATGTNDCGNTANAGAGVSVSGTLTIKSGAVISHNYVPVPGPGYAWNGGGIAVSSGKVIMEDGAKIICNASGKNGGGIYLQSNGQLIMTGGEISGNVSVGDGGAVYSNGSFTMGGTAYIPYGGAEKKNDVYLVSGKCITIDSVLSKPSDASGANATITPASWTRGTVVAQGKDGGVIPYEMTTSGSIGKRLALAAADADDNWVVELTSDEKEAKIFAPIYVAAGAAYNATTNPGGYRKCKSEGLNSNMGTKSAPYATLTKALTDLTDPNRDYIVFIDGKVTDNVTLQLNTTDHAKSLTLKGATTTSINADTADCLDGGGANMVLWMKGNTPVTITYLKVSGGKAGGSGGGICLNSGATLNLEALSFVTDNLSQGDGAGIYVGGTLNVKNSVKVYGNKKIDSSDNVICDSNVYLPHGKVMAVSGSLTGSEIYVSAYDEPTITGSGASATVNTVTITSGYKNKIDATVPNKYFIGDKYGASCDSVTKEVVLGLNAGSITVEDPYKGMTFRMVDAVKNYEKTYAQKSKLGTSGAQFTIKGSISGLGDADFTTPTSSSYVDISLSLKYHGIDVPTTYYTCPSKNQIKLNAGLQAGDYVVCANAVYKGKNYTAVFDLKLVDDTVSVPSGFVLTGGTTIKGKVGTDNPSLIFVDGRNVNIPAFYACDHEVTQAEYEKYCCYGTNRPTAALGKGDNYPAYYVSWYDAILYCNLRSMAEGLTPVYSIGSTTNPKSWTYVNPGSGADMGKYCGPSESKTNWNGIKIDPSADGYRLPTEAEWEFLTRYNATTNKMMDTAYSAQTTNSGDDTLKKYAWYSANASGKTHTINTWKHAQQSNASNRLGLWDMSGNVAEWCWDWYLAAASIGQDTPDTGPATGIYRLTRGGSWNDDESVCRVYNRSNNYQPYERNQTTGFRVVRNAN
ncbi:MAG: formylglycine-generating enzyme family protein [Treponema sp.]|nr:formylglycine-generating enzyme family protein [Treponema sp.]